MTSTCLNLENKIKSLEKEIAFYRNKLKNNECDYFDVEKDNIFFLAANNPVELQFSSCQERVGFKSMVFNVPDMIMRFDKDHRHIFVNASSIKILKIPAAKILGSTHAELGFSEEKCDLWRDALNKVFTNSETSTIQFDLLWQNELTYYEWRIIPEFDIHNNVCTVLTIARDITQRVIAEKSLKEYLYAKDKFFSILSHDLKSPLGSICAFSKLIEDNLSDLPKDELAQYIKLISSSAQNTYILLEEILEWAKNQGGLLKSQPVKLNLFDVLNKNKKLYDDKFFEKKINLFLTCNKNYYIFVDENIINLIVRNLLSNAVKYTNKGGNIYITVQKKLDNIILCIADDGVGIAEKYQDSVLRLDAKYHTHGTLNEIGTGVGLKFCMEYAKIINANLYFTSKQNVGSKFYLSLPIGEIN